MDPRSMVLRAGPAPRRYGEQLVEHEVVPLNRWAILALLFAIRAGMGFQFEVVPALSPAFISVFQASVADIGFLLGLYQAPGLIFAFLGGVIGQRLGDRSGVN